MANDITVYIVEGDDSVGCAMVRLMRSAGHRSVRFSSMEAFEAHVDAAVDRAVVLADTATACGSGRTLPDSWRLAGAVVPVIYLTREGSEDGRKEALRVGAGACFRKPVDRLALLDAIAFLARPPMPSRDTSGSPGDEQHGD